MNGRLWNSVLSSGRKDCSSGSTAGKSGAEEFGSHPEKNLFHVRIIIFSSDPHRISMSRTKIFQLSG